MNRRWRTTAAATIVTVVVYRGVQWLQLLVTRDVHPRPGEIRSVSDLILAAAFGVALFLWLNLRATRARLTAAERSQVVIETELALAAQVQRRLLPAVPPARNDVRWATRLHPAGKIGGDFYDFIPAADGSTLLLVGDVSGKGIPAALVQVSAHALFRTYSRQASHPAELLRLVSHEVFSENGGELYLTCLALHVDGPGRRVTYVNAGHPPGLLLSDRGRRLLDKGGVPVGMFPEAMYQAETLSIEPGEVGVIVTDGITEAVEQDGVSAVDRLTAALSSEAWPPTPDRVCDLLMSLAAKGRGPSGVSNWDDDRTVVAFELQPPVVPAALPLTA